MHSVVADQSESALKEQKVGAGEMGETKSKDCQISQYLQELLSNRLFECLVAASSSVPACALFTVRLNGSITQDFA